MSVRLLANRIVKNGRLIFRKHQIPSKIIDTTKNPLLPKKVVPRVTVAQTVRKSFFDSVLSTSAYISRLQNAAKTVFNRNNTLFAFISVGIAGNGILSKEDELEGVCSEIRDLSSKIQNSWNYEEICSCIHREIGLDDLDVGQPIGKGCSAVVYSASLKSEYFKEEQMETEEVVERISSVHNISRFIHSSGKTSFRRNIHSTAATVSLAELHRKESSGKDNQEKEPKKEYPLAMKMMFNYDIQSNAMSIIRAMSKETIPARNRDISGNGQLIDLLRKEVIHLPSHPNIVCMFGFFCAPVGNFHDGASLYPSAQPPRINPQGYGRNMSLYLVMKRYNTSLKDLLENYELSSRNRMLLFAQLLEAVSHLNRYGVAHRDLKTDNILIDLHEKGSCPELVLTDFGCALANKTYGLRIPYPTDDIDKGGNSALMAPEIITKSPGRFAILDYTKADLWASGTIAYEIFGQENPFYDNECSVDLNNFEYKLENLPAISSQCPALIRELIHNILNPNPNNRVRPEVAANIMQLFLWAPSKWLKKVGSEELSSNEIIEWLLSLTYKLVCDNTEKNCFVDYILINNFLSRARLNDIKAALSWIAANN